MINRLNFSLFLLITLSCNFLYGQFGSKIEFSPLRSNEIEAFESPAVAVGDIDNDGDLDMVVTGELNNNPETYFFVNDGYGHFDHFTDNSVRNTTLGNALAFSDIDNDGDLDLFQTGSNSGPQTNLYSNVSTHNFNRISNTPFTDLRNGTISIADVDGDNDLDVFFTGWYLNPISVLYRNSGFGTYTTAPTPSIAGVEDGISKFFDFEGDGDPDLLVSGEEANGNVTIKRYYNNGSGGFQFVNSSMVGAKNGDIAVADFDGDSDLDVFVTGETQNGLHTSFVYFNNGNGVLTFSAASTSIAQVSNSTCDTLDYDKDGNVDLIVSGELSSGTKITRLYRNNGSGVFQQVASFNGISDGFNKAFDINNDGYTDIVFMGESNFTNPRYIAQIFINDQNGGFNSATEGASFTGVFNSVSTMIDVDLDNRLDYLQSGVDDTLGVNFTAYINDLQANDEYIAFGTPFVNVTDGDILKSDFNQDGREDFIVSGYDASTNSPVTRMYVQTGALAYFNVTGLPFDDLGGTEIGAADIDGDSDLDIVLSGTLAGGMRSAKLYTSNGAVSYSNNNQNIIDVANGSVEFADIDGDSDQDLFICGVNSFGENKVRTYRNNGTGQFSAITGLPFDSLLSSAAKFGDIDGDGDLDLVLVGADQSNHVSHVYLNDGSGNFTEKQNQNIIGVWGASMVMQDIDQDSDLDLLIIGNNNSGRSSTLYINDGQGNFAIAPTPFIGFSNGSIAIGDVNGDNLDDVILSGYIDQTIPGGPNEASILYLNNSCSYTQNTLNRSACDSFTSFSGKTWNSSGTYYDTLASGNCGIIFTFNVTIDTNTTASISDTVCGNFVAPSGKIINQSGNFKDTISNVAGCDSIIDISLLILNTDTLIQDTACSQYFTVTSKLIDSSGTYFDTIPNTANCDSIIEYQIVIQSNDTLLNRSACDSYFSPSGNLYTQSGTYQDTLVNALNCDSIIVTNLQINESKDTTINATACYQFTSPSGLIWDTTGTYYDTIPTQLGCDSNMTFNLVINDTTYNSYLVSACASFQSPSGRLFTQSGIIQDTIPNSNGCDSILTINLSILETDTSFNATACNSYVSPSGQIWSSSGSYQDTIQNQAGCDSLISIQLMLLDSDSTLNITTCKDYNSPSGNVYTNSGQYLDTISNQAGCDSILTINLTIYQPNSAFSVRSCQPFTSPNGTVYSSSTTIVDTLQNGLGCDSIITIDLTIYQADTNLSVSACKQFIAPSGKIFTSSGNFTDTIPNGLGCDSLINLNLTILNSSSSSLNVTKCGTFTSASGKVFNQSGTYLDTIPNQQGCDSIITYQLTLKMESNSSQSVTKCGTFTSASGKLYSQSGTYFDTIPNQQGCDSIITYQLTLNMETSSSLNETACNSYILPSGGLVFNSGTYQDTISNSAGCDSIITINLTLVKQDTSITKQIDTLTIGSLTAQQYQWYSCDFDTLILGADQRQYVATKNGEYAGIVKEGNCSDTSRCVRVTSIGLEEQLLNSSFNIYPNPTTNDVFLEFGKLPTQAKEAAVISTQGKVVKHFTLKHRITRIQLSDLSKGLYFIQVGQVKKKLIVM